MLDKGLKKWNELDRDIKRMTNIIPIKIEEWANRVVQDLYNKIKDVTPMDEGDLRKSLKRVFYNHNTNTAELYFEGDHINAKGVAVEKYAMYQHEHLFKNYTTTGTGPLFVTKPFQENKKKYEKWFDEIVGGKLQWK